MAVTPEIQNVYSIPDVTSRYAEPSLENLTVEEKSEQLASKDHFKGWKLFLILAGLSTVNISSFVSIYILTSFFLKVCEDREISGVESGAIIGIAQCVTLVMAYAFLGMIHKMPMKYQMALGMTIAAITLFCFAFTDRILNNVWFVVICIILRAIQGTAVSVGDVCSLFVANKTSPPEKLGTIVGYLEMCVSLAAAIAPILGGWLYEVAGYSAPFLVSGGMLIFSGLLVLCTIPKIIQVKKKYISQMVKDTMKVKLYCIQFLLAGIFLGFFDGMIEPQLRQFHLSTVLVGVVMFINSGVSGFAFPLLGFISDYSKKPAAVAIISCVVGSVGMILFGPFPGLPLQSLLWIVIFSLVLIGLSECGFIIATYSQCRVHLGQVCESDENADIVSSASYISTINFGCFLGSILGGVFIDYIGYPNGSAVLLGMEILAILIQVVLCLRRKAKERGT